ncbi:MAG TPA: VOC family protein [Stellaceae bacterium]|nr:VOC family protein [Stellaceae bacterium]
MFAKLNHLAIVSENYALSGRFYEAMFGMTTSSRARPESAVVVADGYLGLNINPRRAGRAARLDHFGVEVADVETVYDRMRKKYPKVEWLKRPSNRPFAGITTHDPDGNLFDLSQRDMDNRRDVYVEMDGAHERHINHFALRTMNPDALAEFYRDVLELEPRNRAEGDRNHYLSDGHITLVIMPWHITDYADTGISSPALEHIGFTVESVAKFNADMERVVSANPSLAPQPVGTGPEGKARLELARRSCPLCQHHLADIDGVMLSVAEQ